MAFADDFLEEKSLRLFIPILLKRNHFNIISNSTAEENMQKNLENALFCQQKQGHPNPEMTTFNISISRQGLNLLVTIHSPEKCLAVTLMWIN